MSWRLGNATTVPADRVPVAAVAANGLLAGATLGQAVNQ
jgi:hypothetical protein